MKQIEYDRWTIRNIDELVLGWGLLGVCDSEWHTKCLTNPRGCSALADMGFYGFPGATFEEKQAEQRKQALEVVPKCRCIKVIIEEG